MKVLISSRSFGKINSGAIQLLMDNGFDLVLNPYGKKLSEKEILGLMDDDIVGIIAGTELITKKIIEKSINLQVISRYGVGLDNVDLKEVGKKDILVYNTPDAPALAVAELALSLMLNLLKKIGIGDRRLRKKKWKGEVGNLLTKKTVGIIGLGKIGKKVVEFLEPFQVQILATEPYPDKQFISEKKIKLVSFDDLISSSDIISLHVPLNNETKHIIGENELSKMKQNSILVNTSRGGLIKEDDLYNALKERRIAGAGVDVFEREPDTNRLETLENIVVTPHIGTLTIETRRQMEIEAAENLINGLKKVKVL